MFGVKINQAKTMFFDRPKVMRALGDATRRSLSKFGAFVRTRARSSILKRKKVSAPNSPPFSHLGFVKNFILFGYDETTRSVVIGPIRLNRTSDTALSSLEKGGESIIRTGTRRHETTRKVYIRKRPFMKPAFDAELPKAAPQFKDSMRGP